MKKIAFIFALIVAFMPFAASAQNSSVQPVKWRTTVKMTSAKEGVLTLKAIITNGWHMYGTTLPKDGPKATEFDFAASKGVKFTDNFTPSSKPVVKNDEMFGLTLNWWESTVTFTRHFKLTGKVDDALIEGTITYMSCNNTSCMPPKKENIKAKVQPYKK